MKAIKKRLIVSNKGVWIVSCNITDRDQITNGEMLKTKGININGFSLRCCVWIMKEYGKGHWGVNLMVVKEQGDSLNCHGKH